MSRWLLPLALVPLALPPAPVSPIATPMVPSLRALALDNHEVQLPRDLAPATVLILGFSRTSADATTTWQKPVLTTLTHAPTINYFDMPMLAAIPSFARPLVLRSIRKQVPDILKPNFVPLLDHEDQWKSFAGYTERAPDAAYVLLVDRNGTIRWQTHEAFTPQRFALLVQEARILEAEGKG